MNNQILFVDDDLNLLHGLQRSLRKECTFDIAQGANEALALMKDREPYAVIVADMQMPGLNGLQFLEQAGRLAPDTVRLMLTGNADQKTAVDAVNRGQVFQFLTKPCRPEELLLALNAGVKQYRLVTAERALLENTLNGTISVLTGILTMVDPASFGLGERLRDYMRRYTRHAQIREAWSYELAAMLSQIGHVTIPLKVLIHVRSGIALRVEESEMVRRVPRTGADLLAKIPRLEPVAEIVLYQGKHFDGAGFPPDDIVGEAIPLGARILKILGDLLELEAKGQSRSTAAAQLRSRFGWYDPGIFDDVVASLKAADAELSAEGGLPCDVGPKDLLNGDVFSANVETNEGTLVVIAGTVISSLLLEKLHNFDQIVGLRRPLLVNRPRRAVAP